MSLAAEAWQRSGAQPIVLVTIRAPARMWRLASEAVSVEDADTSEVYHYGPGLLRLPSLDSEVDLWASLGDQGLRSFSVDVALDDDASALQGAWWEMTAARVELATIWPGETWQERVRVVEEARVVGIELGGEGEASSLSLEEVADLDGDSPVDATRDIGTDQAPTLGYTPLVGRPFPVVIGVVERVPAYKMGVTGGGRGALLTGHHLAADVVVGDLTWYEDGVSSTPAAPTLTNGTDSAGNPIAYVETAAGGEFDSGTGAYTVSFTGGGYPSVVDGTRAAVNAAEVIEVLLALSGLDVDWPATRRALSLVSDWSIGVYLDAVEPAGKVLRERVLPLLPLQLRRGARGAYLAVTDPWRAPVAAELVEGVGLLDRIGPVRTTDLTGLVNEVVIEYGYDHWDGSYRDRLTVGPDDYGMARYSQQLYGVRPASVQTTITWDETTARRMGNLYLWRRAIPRRLVAFAADASVDVAEGDIVTLTAASLGIDTATRAVVRRLTRLAAPRVITLEVHDRTPANLGG